jgi:hypothetical protein
MRVVLLLALGIVLVGGATAGAKVLLEVGARVTTLIASTF